MSPTFSPIRASSAYRTLNRPSAKAIHYALRIRGSLWTWAARGVPYLIASIVGMSGLAVVLRVGIDRGASPIALNTAFRVSAGLVTLAVAMPVLDWARLPELAGEAGGLGLIAAAGFWTSGFAAINAVKHGHLGISWTILRCAMLVPALASLLYWQEVPLVPVSGLLVLRLGGIAAATLAIVLSGYDRIQRDRSQQDPRASRGSVRVWLFWVALAFVAQAVWETSVVASRQLPDEASRTFFTTTVFVAAGAVALGFNILTRMPFSKTALCWGGLAGLCSLLGSGARVWATRDLGGLVVFPVTAITVLFFVQLASVGIWRERMGRWGIAGFAAAVGGVVLLSLRT